MTLQIAIVLAILAGSMVLFVSGRIRMDVVALLVLGLLAVTGLVGPTDAVAGFSNPAVITVWAMFILSAALTRTGVAAVIGRQILRLAGSGETRMVTVIMLSSAGLSAFMNNIGVAALLMPVVLDVARRTGHRPSRLLMPLAYGSLLGGLTTLIGTPPNLLVSEAIADSGRAPFGLFDFTPVGGAVMLAGVAFVAVVGRRMLPQRDPGLETAGAAPDDLRRQYALDERTVMLRLPAGSPLAGLSLRESRLGSATGLNVIAVLRGASTIPAPRPEFLLEAGDLLEVEGTLDRHSDLRAWRELVVEDAEPDVEKLSSDGVILAELQLTAGSALAGLTLDQTRFRERYGGIVLAVGRDSGVLHSGLADVLLQPGDRLLVQGRRVSIDLLAASADFQPLPPTPTVELARRYGLDRRLFVVRLPRRSVLAGRTLAESRLGDALALGVLGLDRGGDCLLMPEPGELLQEGDRLLVRGHRRDLAVFRGLQQLEVADDRPPDVGELESDQVGLFEAMLSPRTSLARKTLRQLDFRVRYGLQVLAVLREGEVIRTGLRDIPLRFGDALLLLGTRERARLIAGDPDFLMLTADLQPRPTVRRAAVSSTIMLAVMAAVLLTWLPISIAAVVGATLMVLTRCLTMEEAYHSIEWRSVFLIAGMLPLGVALQETGAAAFLADGVLALARPLGAWGVVVALYLVTAAATMIIPTAALVVLMAPIALKASAEMGISPESVMMAVAIAASASFTSPISHPANVLVMGPGGYRFGDYLKVGIPLTLVVLVVALLLLPLVWPF